jgi:hypothetical protein
MFETYRMLGEQREAELLREARRLQAGASVRLGARRHGAYLDSSLALARRAMGKMAWLTGFIRRPSSILIQSPGGPPSEANDSGLAVDKLPVAGIRVATENEGLRRAADELPSPRRSRRRDLGRAGVYLGRAGV